MDVDDIDFDELEPDLEMDEEWQHLGELLHIIILSLYLFVFCKIFRNLKWET